MDDQAFPVLADGRHRGVGVDLDVVMAKCPLELRCQRRVERGGQDLGQAFQHGHAQAAGVERCGHLHADVAGADEHRGAGLALLEVLDQAEHVADGVQRVHPRSGAEPFQPVDRRACRHRSGCDHQPVVAHRVAGAGPLDAGHLLGGQVQPRQRTSRQPSISACATRATAAEREVGKWTDEVDERRRCPPPFAAADLRPGPTPQVHQGSAEQRQLESGSEDDPAPLPRAAFIPALRQDDLTSRGRSNLATGATRAPSPAALGELSVREALGFGPRAL